MLKIAEKLTYSSEKMEKSILFKEFLGSTRKHRIENYWDVTFDDRIEISQFTNGVLTDFINKTNESVKHIYKNISIYNEDLFSDATDIDKSLKLVKIEFSSCDFYGNNGGRKLTFKNCNFDKCYFSFSIFNDVNFINCKFNSCSFAQAKFYRCIFDSNCSFYEMSISGGKTKFINSEINPLEFFSNIHKPFEKKIEKYQPENIPEENYRLYRSIVKLSRNILESNNSCSNDELYYFSVKNLLLKKVDERKLYTKKKVQDIRENINTIKQDNAGKKNKDRFNLFSLKLKEIWLHIINPMFSIEKTAILLFGFMNSWGGSLQRIFVSGVLILLLYSCLYCLIGDGSVNRLSASGQLEKTHVIYSYYFYSNLIKSFDITFLAGYTKHITSNDSLLNQAVILSNMLIGLFWYAVAIPSLINKLSIARL